VARFGGAVELGFSSSITLASLVVDRLVGMAGMAMTAPFGLIPLWQWGAANAAQSLTLAGLWQKGLEFVKKTFSALKLWLSRPGGLLGALACTWGHMLCTFASVAILLGGLNSPISFGLIAGLWSLAYFITLIPVSINGYGLQEISLTYLFAHVGGVGMANSLALAVLIRVLTTIASLPGAFFLPSIMAALDKSSQK
jgi:glycosyltransferase 2 family protein